LPPGGGSLVCLGRLVAGRPAAGRRAAGPGVAGSVVEVTGARGLPWVALLFAMSRNNSVIPSISICISFALSLAAMKRPSAV
jgi:hypothetical protein